MLWKVRKYLEKWKEKEQESTGVAPPLNIIAGLCGKEIIVPMKYEGNMDAKLFNTYLEKILLPELEVGSVIVMDNASYHKSKKTRELIEEKGCDVSTSVRGVAPPLHQI